MIRSFPSNFDIPSSAFKVHWKSGDQIRKTISSPVSTWLPALPLAKAWTFNFSFLDLWAILSKWGFPFFSYINWIRSVSKPIQSIASSDKVFLPDIAEKICFASDGQGLSFLQCSKKFTPGLEQGCYWVFWRFCEDNWQQELSALKKLKSLHSHKF